MNNIENTAVQHRQKDQSAAGDNGNVASLLAVGNATADRVVAQTSPVDLTSWRTWDALQFKLTDAQAMRTLLSKTTLFGQPKWVAAASGDGPAAVAVAVSFIPARQVTPSLDLAMTALLACAIEGDAGAQIIASNILINLPGTTARHKQIAGSWFSANSPMASLSRLPMGSETAHNMASHSETVAPKAFELWREIPATGFDESLRRVVVECVAETIPGVKSKVWMAAIAGDALCAIRIARELAFPIDKITRPVDVRLTLLLHCALKGSANAARALSSLLRKMPLERKLKDRLALSWLARSQHRNDFGEPDVAPRRSHLRLVPKPLGQGKRKS